MKDQKMGVLPQPFLGHFEKPKKQVSIADEAMLRGKVWKKSAWRRRKKCVEKK